MRMNIPHIGFHLDEAEEQLRAILKNLQNAEYSEAEFRVHMQHLYHHINYAWNTRNSPQEDLNGSTDADFVRWSRYPSDLPTSRL